MVSLADLSFQKHRYSSTKSIQFFSFLALAGVWTLFVTSAFNYSHFTWFPWLISSRVVMVACALLLASIVWFSKKLYPHILEWYLVACLFTQASHGILEDPNKSDFYSYIGIVFILMALAFRGSMTTWLKYYLPVLVSALVIPILFKEEGHRNTLPNIIDSFSLPIAGFVFANIMAKINSSNWKLLNRVNSLQSELLSNEREANKKLNEQLEMAKAKIEKESKFYAIGEMSAFVTHNLANDLDSLEIFYALVENDIPSEKMRVLRNSLDGFRTTIANLGEQAKNRDKEKIRRTPTIMEPLIQDALHSCRIRYMDDQTLNLSYKSFAADFWAICKVDDSEFSMMLKNMVHNSYQAVRSAGRGYGKIEVKSGIGQNSFWVSIRDNGCGISKSDLPHVLESGFSTKGTTGLGLAHANASLGDWGGRIRIFSKEGHGTAIKISVPLSLDYHVSRVTKAKESYGEVVSLDDSDRSSDKIRSIFAGRAKFKHCSTVDEFSREMNSPRRKKKAPFVTVDYHLNPSDNVNGVDVILSQNLTGSVVLVSSEYKSQELLESLTRHKIPFYPKNLLNAEACLA